MNPYVFLDERGSHLGLTRLDGRAAPGQRVHDHVPGDRGGNVATIGALPLDGLRPGLSVPGPIDGDTMGSFVEELLVPTLHRGEIVVMDNGRFITWMPLRPPLKPPGRGSSCCRPLRRI